MAEKQPIGVISIGSNDIHLLVADSDGSKTFEKKVNQSILAELVGAVRNGVLPVKVIGQALENLETLVNSARGASAKVIIAIATEALREAANGSAFLELVGTTLGIATSLISGQEEAALDYCWATFASDPTSPLLVVDSGGGSTQVILGEGPTPTFGLSLPIGAGNMTKQFLKHDPPEKDEMQALDDHIAPLIDALPLVITPQNAILMGGSADHLLQFAADPRQSILTRDDLHQALHELHKKEAKEIAHDHDCLEERAHLLTAGAIILLRVLTKYGIERAYIKPNGIRGGLVIAYARYGEAWRQQLALPPGPNATESTASH